MSLPPKHIRDRIEAQILDSPQQLAKVVDYLLVTTDNHGGRTPAGWQGSVDVAADIKIEQLDNALAERLLRATELRGEKWDLPGRDPVVHAYVRQVWAREDGGTPGGRLGRRRPALRLSRPVPPGA